MTDTYQENRAIYITLADIEWELEMEPDNSQVAEELQEERDTLTQQLLSR